MTNRTDRLARPIAGAGFRWPPLAFAFLLALGAIAVFAAAFAVGYTRLHDGKVVPGVDVGGVSLAGLTRPEAEAKLRETLPALSSGRLTVRFADTEERIRYSEIGRDYDFDLMLDQAFGVGRSGSRVAGITEQLRVLLRGVSIEPSVTWDARALQQRVTAAAAAAGFAAIDATLVRDGSRYVVTPAKHGRSVDAPNAVALANAAVNNLNASDTTVEVEPVRVPPAVTTIQAQAAADRFDQVTGAPLVFTAGGVATTVAPATIAGWTRLEESAPGEWTLVIDPAPLEQLVVQHAREVDVAAEDATFAFQGEVVVAVAGRTGRAVDVEASVRSVLSELERRAGGSTSSNVELPMVTVLPEFTTEEAQALAPRVEMLSRWRTDFVPGPANYSGRNIAIPTDIIDGTVVEPGEEFDFLDVIGPITSPPYGDGAAIIRGRTRLDGALGGGMCSTSTTLFNAALRAGLEMGDRRNHYYYIDRYPAGLDATVWIASDTQRQTMSFTNDMDHPILVRGINRTGRVIFEIWGVPDGRTVSLSEPQISDRKQPLEKIQYVDSLPPGQRERVEWPVVGYKSVVVRTVRDATGSVIHEDTYFSNYRRIDGITQVGRYPGDPEHGTFETVSGGGDAGGD